MVKRFKLLGKRWEFVYVNTLNTLWGYCGYDTKQIVIAKDIPTDELAIDTIIHECLHAASENSLSEEFVTGVSTDIARLLTRLGYGRID